MKKKINYRQKILLLNFTFFVICTLSFQVVAQTKNRKLTPREIAQQTLPSTVLLLLNNNITKKAKSGSGFFVGEDVVATNFHVIKETNEGYVKIYGQDKIYEIAGVIGIDEQNDLALLKIKGIKGKPLKLNTDDSIAIGDEVFAVGNPEGLEGTFSQGIISSIRKTDKINLLQITASISAGSSGGAIINDKGEVIGVAVGAIENGQSLNFAVPIVFLRSLILKQNLPEPLSKYKTTVKKNSIGMELVWIPPGEFMSGLSQSNLEKLLYLDQKDKIEFNFPTTSQKTFSRGETSQRKVTIKEGFWMGKYEVTQKEWKLVMGNNPSKFNKCGDNCPVESISWDDIQVFLERLNKKNDGFEYRLPMEVEWEYAARAGNADLYGGTDNINDVAWFKGNSNNMTHPVGQKKPNAFGLHDMIGNVEEWVKDTCNTTESTINWKVYRGGAYLSGYTDSRVTFGSCEMKDYPLSDYRGFRVIAYLK